MPKIEKSDLRNISYQEFGQILDALTKKIAGSGIVFDLVVPILRSGAFTGMHIASKLGITNVLPVQYKYNYVPKETIEKKFEFPKLGYQLPENINILIVDSNTMSGGIAKRAIADIHVAFSKAKIYFASANLDQSITTLDNIEKIFYGALSNERRLLSREEADKKGITNDVLIFPWEDIDEQWRDMSTYA